MNNRLRTALAALIIVMSVYQLACPRTRLVVYGRTTADALRETSMILRSAQLSTVRVDQAAEIADRLVAALTAKDNPTAIEQTTLLITAFQGIVIEVNLIRHPATRTMVLVALAVANVALHHIAEALAVEGAKIPAAARGRVVGTQVVEEFMRRPKWRCRSAKSGRFEKMSFCKANPDLSVVETYY